MCKYNYKNKNDKLNDTPCVYPDFFIKNENILLKTLPIDKNGFCIFHSVDKLWKEENNFEDYFSLLVNKIPIINKDVDKIKWKYDFIGFVFTEELIIDKIQFQNQIDFSNCFFNKKVLIKEIEISSIDFQHSYFKDFLSIKNTIINSNIYASKSKFENGIIIKECELNGNNYFEECVFNNINSSVNCEIGIKNNKKILSFSFENSSITPRVSINKTTIEQELCFDKCNIYNEFLFENNTINGIVSFRQTDFLLSENLSTEYSNVTFGNNQINTTGKIIFNGNKPMDDMVKGELAIYFKEAPLGLISFENFDLNKIYLPNKIKILELEKESPNIVSIASSCSKYYCKTEIFTIEATNANQNLILDFTKVFCNYFELQESSILGIEIVEKKQSIIRYYYFTDERISEIEFSNKINKNESNLWLTFSKLTDFSINSAKDVEIKNVLIDIYSIFLKLGNNIQNNLTLPQDVSKILSSISTTYSIIEIDNKLKTIINQNNSILETQKILPSILEDIYSLTPKTTIFMKVTNNIYGNVENLINSENFFEGNKNISNEEKIIIQNEIEEIQNENSMDEKNNKFEKFVQKWGSTITEVGITLAKNLIFP